jgi:hypothetical protein
MIGAVHVSTPCLASRDYVHAYTLQVEVYAASSGPSAVATAAGGAGTDPVTAAAIAAGGGVAVHILSYADSGERDGFLAAVDREVGCAALCSCTCGGCT